ncbi:MAG TPA: FHA domain-containing protein [Candidatus Nanoarchaeia archaeon]|nr:FHA domain-containing protein [Candidatus Nanoarchaeia archaeon]
MGWLDRLRGKKAIINILSLNKFINSYDLTEDKVEIGRTTEDIKGLSLKIPGKILLVTQVNTQTVSRNHATLEWDPAIKRYRLIDHSRFGTVLDGESIHKNNIGERVENGANIFISPFTFQLFYK